MQNSTHDLVRFSTLRKIPAGINRVDLHRTFTREQHCAGSFAQNHAAWRLVERFNRRLFFEKAPSVIGIAQQPVRFFRAYHETKIQRFIVK